VKLQWLLAKELASYLRGWKSCFGFCETPAVFRELDKWIRRRLRSVVWKQWKRGRVRFARLCARGVSQTPAAQTAGSALGPWRPADSPALHDAHLQQRVLVQRSERRDRL
jgi:RNA-directed DNA polymerase